MSQPPENQFGQPSPPTSEANPAANPYATSQPDRHQIYDGQLVGDQLYPSYNQGDGTGGLIPYKNPKALLAYYFGVFSLIPLLGIPLGITAFVLGILGLRDRKRNPIIKGTIHAWIGIIFGGGLALLQVSLIVFVFVAAARS